MHQRLLKFEYQRDEELLRSILDSPAKAKSIAARFTLSELAAAHLPELELSHTEYDRLMAAIELGRRIVDAARGPQMIKINGAKDAITFCQKHFATLIREAVQEEFHIVTLSSKNSVIDTHRITIGTLDASLVHPREVFRPAIKDSCSSVILAHNHPSNDPTPSREDLAVTKRLEESGKLLGIDVLDHIVMGRDGCVSIREL